MKPKPSDNFFSRRWRRQVPLSVLLWRDMLGIGTAINLAGTIAALMLAAHDAPLAVAVTVHFAPLPYNLFLFAALLRAPQRTRFSSAAGTVWLVLMTWI